MKKRTKRTLKQSIKYLVWLLIFIIGISTYRILWSLGDTAFWIMLGSVMGILIFLILFDLAKWKDLIPIFKN